MGLSIQGTYAGGGTTYTLDIDSDRHMPVTPRAPAFGSLGYYQMAVVSGSIAATLAASSPLFSFRWTSSTDLCIVQSVKVGCITNASSALVDFDLALFVARSFTASDTGGTSVLPTGNSQKMRTSMGTTLAGAINIASTGTLTAGTRTLDGSPHARIQGASSASVGGQFFPGQNPAPLYLRDNCDHHPLVFAQNEGFVITNPLAGPASGTFVLLVQMTWGEVAAY